MSDKTLCGITAALLSALLIVLMVVDTTARSISADNIELKRIIREQKERIVDLETRVYTTSSDTALPAAKDCTYYDIELPKELQLYTWQCCQHFGVDYKLFISLMWQESRFKVDSFSSSDYIRYVQMDPNNVQDISDNLGRPIDIHNEYDNILAGVYWFSRFVEKYPDDIYMQLKCYSIGEYGASIYENEEYYNNILSYYLNI